MITKTTLLTKIYILMLRLVLRLTRAPRWLNAQVCTEHFGIWTDRCASNVFDVQALLLCKAAQWSHILTYLCITLTPGSFYTQNVSRDLPELDSKLCSITCLIFNNLIPSIMLHYTLFIHVLMEDNSVASKYLFSGEKVLFLVNHDTRLTVWMVISR